MVKRSGWVLYIFDDDNKKEIFKIMEFSTMRQLSYVLDVSPTIISNWYHGLINPRGVLKNSAIIALGIDISMTKINSFEKICLKFSLLNGIAWLFCIIHEFRFSRNRSYNIFSN